MLKIIGSANGIKTSFVLAITATSFSALAAQNSSSGLKCSEILTQRKIIVRPAAELIQNQNQSSALAQPNAQTKPNRIVVLPAQNRIQVLPAPVVTSKSQYRTLSDEQKWRIVDTMIPGKVIPGSIDRKYDESELLALVKDPTFYPEFTIGMNDFFKTLMEYGRINVLKAILERPDFTLANRPKVLYEAYRSKKDQIIDLIAARTDINVTANELLDIPIDTMKKHIDVFLKNPKIVAAFNQELTISDGYPFYRNKTGPVAVHLRNGKQSDLQIIQNKVEAVINPQSADVNSTDKITGRSKLIQAVIDNDIVEFKKLLATPGIDVNQKVVPTSWMSKNDKFNPRHYAGRDALAFAIENGNKEMVQLLTDFQGLKFDSGLNNSESYFSLVFKNHDMKTFRILLKNLKSIQSNVDYVTEAISTGNSEMAAQLIKHGATFNTKKAIESALFQKNYKMFMLLLNRNELKANEFGGLFAKSLETQTKWGNGPSEPQHLVDLRIVEELLKRSEVTDVESSLSTDLLRGHLGNEMLIKLLFKYRPNLKYYKNGSSGHSLVEWAIMDGSASTIDLITNMEGVKIHPFALIYGFGMYHLVDKGNMLEKILRMPGVFEMLETPIEVNGKEITPLGYARMNNTPEQMNKILAVIEKVRKMSVAADGSRIQKIEVLGLAPKSVAEAKKRIQVMVTSVDKIIKDPPAYLHEIEKMSNADISELKSKIEKGLRSNSPSHEIIENWSTALYFKIYKRTQDFDDLELATSDQSKLERFIFQNNNVINHGELVALCEKFTLDPSIPFDKKEDVILKLQAAMPGWDSTFGDKILLNWMKQLSDNELIQLRSKIKGIIDNPNGIKRDNFYKFYGPDGLVRMDIDIFKRAWRLGFFEKEKNTIPPQAHHWKNIFGRTVDAGNIAAIEFMLTDPTLYVNEELSPPYYSPLEGALGGTDLSIAELLLKNPRIQPSLETVERVYERYSAEAVELLFAYRSFTLDDYYKALSFQVVDDNNLGKSVENKKRSALLNKSTIDLGNGGPVLPPLFASIALKNFNLFSELMKDKKLNLKVKDQEGRGVNEYIATLPANLKPHFEKALVAR